MRVENSVLMREAMGGPRRGQHRSEGIKETGEKSSKIPPKKRSGSHRRRRLRSVLREETRIPVEEAGVGAVWGEGEGLVPGRASLVRSRWEILNPEEPAGLELGGGAVCIPKTWQGEGRKGREWGGD